MVCVLPTSRFSFVLFYDADHYWTNTGGAVRSNIHRQGIFSAQQKPTSTYSRAKSACILNFSYTKIQKARKFVPNKSKHAKTTSTKKRKCFQSDIFCPNFLQLSFIIKNLLNSLQNIYFYNFAVFWVLWKMLTHFWVSWLFEKCNKLNEHCWEFCLIIQIHWALRFFLVVCDKKFWRLVKLEPGHANRSLFGLSDYSAFKCKI